MMGYPSMPFYHSPSMDTYADPHYSNSTGASPSSSSDIPPPESRGGCWTCRIRRKKCDEQDEDGGCQTCKRLLIDCLGWSSRRPEWMRDKKAVDDYKAEIKTQLMRNGLIRGQPRAAILASVSKAPSTSRPTPRRPRAAEQEARPRRRRESGPRSRSQQGGGMTHGTSSPSLYRRSAGEYSESNMFGIELPPFPYSPTGMSSLGSQGSELAYSGIAQIPFEFDLPTLPQEFPLVAGQSPLQDIHVQYYFANVHALHFVFGGNAMKNVTYALITSDPRGALTSAVCASASSHHTRSMATKGLDIPDTQQGQSTANVFRTEACFQLQLGTKMSPNHSDADVLAALHLICFSPSPGDATDELLLAMVLDWLALTGLAQDPNPHQTLQAMSATSQLLVKCTMWVDIMSSVTLRRSSTQLELYRRLLSANALWYSGMEMESLTGCPDDALLAVAEMTALADWKVMEQRNGSLSFRELVRRGEQIEERLNQNTDGSPKPSATLNPNLIQASWTSNGGLALSREAVNRMLGGIFREGVRLYIHTVLSGANPVIAEIVQIVERLVAQLNRLPASEVDRALMLPLCLAGCMTDDAGHRESLIGRITANDENSVQARTLLEMVWEKRDSTGGIIDLQGTMEDHGLSVLFV